MVRSQLDNSNSSQQTIREIEFQKSFGVPEEFRSVPIPKLFSSLKPQQGQDRHIGKDERKSN